MFTLLMNLYVFFSPDSNTVLFACIGGGISLLVIVAIATVICVKRRRRKKGERETSHSPRTMQKLRRLSSGA